MKRCPQCEFIYENEQTTCDMDGAMLAFDKDSAAVDGPRSNAKSFAVPAVVGTVLAAVLVLAFYASPLLVAKPDAAQPSPEQTVPSSPVSAPTPIQTVIEAPSTSPSPETVVEPTSAERAAEGDRNHANSKATDSRLTIRRGLPPLPRVPSLPRLPPARAQKSSTSKDQVKVVTPPKKQSKVESFLKKTGRVITKPFKF
ncbi:MAG TPA: hypothetical protein VJU84_07025 [Pyrinomonadaceae bacterium]|nr:hypothetical protein [Pyrinomonadaceae bacterium]